jgi:putative transposase
MNGKYIYLVAVIDWYSRKVLSFRLSSSLDGSFCRDGLNPSDWTPGLE